MREVGIVRRLVVLTVAAGVASLLGAAPALASDVGTTTTTTGQTLTVTIQSPADGTVFSQPGAQMSGTATLSAPPKPGNRPTVQIVGVQFSVDGNAEATQTVQPDGSWVYEVGDYGPRQLGATVIASDGSRATATINVTFPPQPTNLSASNLVVDNTTGIPTVANPMSAQLSSFGGKALVYIPGQTIKFLVNSQVVCTAVTDSTGTATCGNSAASQSAIAAGGYEARFDGTPYYGASSANGGLVWDVPPNMCPAYCPALG